MEPKSLREIMDELEKTMDSPMFDNDDLFTPKTEEPTPEPLNISQRIRSLLADLKPFRLTRKAETVIEEFMTFHLQQRHTMLDLPEAASTYLNLLVRTEEYELASRFSEILRKHLEIPSFLYFSSSESELLQTFESIQNRKRTARTAVTETLLPHGKQFIFIHSCQDAPIFNPDLPSGNAVDASRKKAESYTGMWNEVLTYVRENPRTILVVNADYNVYRDSLRHNSELFYRVCSHHVFIRPLTEDELLQDCLNKLKASSFTLARGFEKNLSTYFHTVYPKAELRSLAFVDDLIRRIYALFLSKERTQRTLTPDCIPKYNPQTQSPEDILSRLDELVGLETVKKEFRDIYTMQLAGLNGAAKPRYHMLFAGNPGTGKTTVAQMTADLFFRMGILKTNKLVVTKPADLVSPWVGGTGGKTAEVIRRAYDGVLFIDEAYGLTNNSKGNEVLNYLIQEMETHSDRLIVIFAGYRDEMQELLKLNPGLSSRIGREIIFEDYTLEELVQIFHAQCRKEGFSLDPSAAGMLEDCLSARMTREYFGNAREIGNILQSLKEAWSAEYYAKASTMAADDPERIFHARHFEKIMPPKKEVSIHDLVGLQALKEKLEIFKKQVSYQKHLREKGLEGFSDSSMHMIFTGNPGTGKTTVAKLIADDLYSIGILKTNRLVVAERKDLISAVPGQTAVKTAEVIKKAVGGVLFVDEAYSLANGTLGHEVIEVFLTAMEEHKADTIFIFAGYSNEMQAFLAINPGIQSRIGYTFHFDNYEPEELTQMFADKLGKAGFVISDDALDRVREIMEYFQSVKNFGNGRFVNHVIQQTIAQRATRDFSEQYRDIRGEDIPAIKTLIATAPDSMQLYDPALVTPQEAERTAFHELGHAVVLHVSDSGRVPESISIKNQAGSLGRVRLAVSSGNQTEEQLLNLIATLLGGKNAEKVFFGGHTTGCSSDYARAKQIAQDMIDKFAMTDFGGTVAEILQEADRRSLEIIERLKEPLAACAAILLERQEISGKEFTQLIEQQ